jgi:hypothetical protein
MFFKEIGVNGGVPHSIAPVYINNQQLQAPTAARASAASGVLK